MKNAWHLINQAQFDDFDQLIKLASVYTVIIPSMIPTRRRRLFVVLLALASLLFMQLAVAGYACPSAKIKTAESAAMANAGMPCAESMATGMDEDQPNLCRAHCQTGQQVADKYELPAPACVDSLPANFTLPVTVAVLTGAPVQAPHLKRTTAPPVTILNCCFRI